MKKIYAVSLFLLMFIWILPGCSDSYDKEITPESVSFTNVNTDEIISLVEGTTFKVETAVLPENATNKEVMYYSSDENIFTVDVAGVITGRSSGEANLTVVTASLVRKVDQRKVVVTEDAVLIESISLKGLNDDNEFEFNMAEISKVLDIEILPATATNKKLTYNSSDENIFYVDESGELYAMSAGKAQLTIETTDGSEKTASYDISIVAKAITVSSIVINEADGNNSIILNRGQKKAITITVLPELAVNKDVEFTSSDESIFTVDPVSGEITAIKPGKATLTVSAQDGSGVTAECTISVAVEISLSQEEVTIDPGETFNLAEILSFEPAEITVNDLDFTSAATDVATVNNSGLIIGVAAGVTTINIKEKNGPASQVFTVKVTGITTVNRANWLVSAQSEYNTTSYKASNAIDGAADTFWNSLEDKQFPKWFMVDMTESLPVVTVRVNRRNNSTYQDTKLIHVYVSNSDADDISDADASFTKVGELDFGAGKSEIFTLDLNLANTPKARYIKLEFQDSNRSGVSVAEFDVVTKISK